MTSVRHAGRCSRFLPAALVAGVHLCLAELGLFRTAFNETSPTGAMIEAWSLKVWREMMADSFTYELTSIRSGCR